MEEQYVTNQIGTREPNENNNVVGKWGKKIGKKGLFFDNGIFNV